MNIKQSNGLTSFLVQSDSNPATWYTVDLLAYWTNGQCDCPDFRCRMEPHLRLGKPERPEWICKHIRFCRTQLKDWLLQALLDHEYRKTYKTSHQAGEPE